MRIAIFYLTGTGNTEFIARELQAAFGPENSTQLLNIEFLAGGVALDQLERFDLVGFGAPVHVFNAAKSFRRFLKRLPNAKGRRAFVFLTAGGGGLAAIRTPRSILSGKGYRIVHEYEYVLPCNCALTSLDPERGELAYNLFGYRGTQNIPETVDAARVAVREVAGQILRGEEKSLPSGAAARFSSAISKPLLDWWLCAVVMKHYPHVTRDCNQCGICASACPTGNIRISRDKVKFGSKCTTCFRCINVCPRQAIFLRWPAGSLVGNKAQYLLPGWKPPRHNRDGAPAGGAEA
jgi:ferredoxin